MVNLYPSDSSLAASTTLNGYGFTSLNCLFTKQGNRVNCLAHTSLIAISKVMHFSFSHFYDLNSLISFFLE